MGEDGPKSRNDIRNARSASGALTVGAWEVFNIRDHSPVLTSWSLNDNSVQ